MSAAITFFISLVLLLAFFVFRSWEEKRGVRVFASVRRGLDETVRDIYQGAVTGSIPAHYRVALITSLRHRAHETVLLLVDVLRAIERPLTRLSYRMRMANPNAPKREVSSFLQTISLRKKEGLKKDEGTGDRV